MNWLGRVCRADFLLRYGLRFGGEAAWLRVFEIAPRDLGINDLPMAGRMPCAPTLDSCQRAGCYLAADP